jgi:hypothetical protein
MMSHRVIAGLCIALCATLAQAASPERERIGAERAAAMARFAEQERACHERFVVTACVEAARKEQRLTLTRLHRAELVLDDTERRETAARRREELQRRAASQDRRAASEPASVERGERTRTAPAPNPPAAVRPQRSASSAEAQREIQQRNEAAFEARTRAAQAHRATVARRNAARASEGKVAAPLPMPAGASAP